MPDESHSVRLYRWLLKLYPAGFRQDYAEPLELEFRDELRDSTGAGDRCALWLRVIADLAVSVPLQLAREAAQDARHTFRLWGRRRWQIALAILPLAIGIGATTGVFSVVNALLLRSLPFRNPERLAYLSNFNVPHDSAAQFHEWRTQSAYLADAALFEPFDVNLGGANEWRRAHVVQVSSNFFSVLGTQPVLGRAFTPGDDVDGTGWGSPGRNAVAVISHGLWRTLFGGDAKVLGATIRIDGVPLTVIGVAPPGFDYPGRSELWKPAAFARGNNGWEAIARLKPGITWPQARLALAAEADRLWPDRTRQQKIQSPPRITALRDELAGPARNASLVLLACAALILLIACANVANLLLAHMADRAAELSIRSALGAGRARLSRQLLTECVLLAAIGSVAGIVVAYWTTYIAAKVQPAPLTSQAYSILDLRVLLFAIAIAISSGLLFGAIPSLYAGRVHAFSARGASGIRRAPLLHNALVAAQVVLAFVLVAASLSVGRAFTHLMQIDRGYAPRNLATVNIALKGTLHQGRGREIAYFEEALARVRRLPGVRSASATEFLPIYATGGIGGVFAVDGQPGRAPASVIPVLSDYFQTMGGRFVAGREFTAAEIQRAARVAVVNERYAGMQFGSAAAAIGHRVSLLREPSEIIGVVKGMDYRNARNDPVDANPRQIFIPSTTPGGFFSAFVARVDGRAEDSLAMIRDAIQSLDPQVPVFGVTSMEQRLYEALARPQFYRTAVTWFAAFALLLAMIGAYGVVSYAVARRTREMGVRMALGATPAGLRLRLLGQALLTIGVGSAAGVAVAALSGRFLEALVEGANPPDFKIYAGMAVSIALIGAAAIWTATRPLARLNVIEILRAE